MSSYANGCMTVVLPVEHIGEFERYFDQDYEYSFRNTEITLTESENVEKAGYQKRIYDLAIQVWKRVSLKTKITI